MSLLLLVVVVVAVAAAAVVVVVAVVVRLERVGLWWYLCRLMMVGWWVRTQ